MSEFPAVKTFFTAAELLEALAAAFLEQMGQAAPHEVLAVLAGQIALETNGGRACLDWDVGNFKAVPGADYQSFLTWEIVAGKRVDMVCRFAVFPSLEQGLSAYLHAMYTRWGAAWHYACLGDVEGFAHGLRTAGYYTAPEADYAAGVARWRDYYLALLGGDSAPTEPELPAPVMAEPELVGEDPEAGSL